MAGIDIRQQLKNHIQSMLDQGILDDYFEHVQTLQNQENPYFLSKVVNVFSHDAETGIAELTKYLREPVVDHAKVICFVHQLRGGSSSVGGHRMAVACRELRSAIEDNKKEECLEALEKVKREYYTLRDNLNIICQMHSSILTNKGRRGP